MEVNIFTLFYLIGALQALFLGALLISKKRLNKPENRLLLGLLICIFLVSVQFSMSLNGLSMVIPWIWPITTASWYMISPLMLLLILSVTKVGFTFKAWHLFLFVVPIYHLVQMVLESLGIYAGMYLFFDNMSSYSFAWLYSYLVYGALFAVVGWRVLHKAQKRGNLLGVFSWVKGFQVLFAGGMILSMAFLMLVSDPHEYAARYEWIVIAVFQIFVFVMVQKIFCASDYLAPVLDSLDLSQTTESKYANSSLGEAQFQRLHQTLMNLMMEKQAFLDKNLSLADLSELSKSPENHLSQLFSQYLKSNFYDFVNAYRLEEWEQRIREPRYQHFKIASLAEDCGFSSKASFYRYFKAVHKMTPTQYLKTADPA